MGRCPGASDAHRDQQEGRLFLVLCRALASVVSEIALWLHAVLKSLGDNKKKKVQKPPFEPVTGRKY